jgi:hypothetical protein
VRPAVEPAVGWAGVHDSRLTWLLAAVAPPPGVATFAVNGRGNLDPAQSTLEIEA